ncbi:MAG TPA: metallophosphoesterase [Opitutaceae bacterium]
MALLTRRKFLAATGALVAGSVAADAFALAPHRLTISEISFSNQPRHRFVVWSDFHYSGDREYAEAVINAINETKPEFVCYLGDLIDQRRYQEEALEFITKIKAPVIGIPGNHDYSCKASFALNRVAFGATGGAWLVNHVATLPGVDLEICGSAERYVGFVPQVSTKPRILLTHYPITARETNGKRFDAIFAGHSHGGQVRIPLYGAVVLPRYVGRYEMGRYESPGGPLYVTQGVGTYKVHARLNCPPEITVVKI